MSTEITIARSSGWHRGENKTIAIIVVDEAGAPVDLSGDLHLCWLLFQSKHNAPSLLDKCNQPDSGAISVGGEGKNEVAISITAEDTLPLAPEVYHHELWNLTEPQLLAYGDAWLLPGNPPEEGI